MCGCVLFSIGWKSFVNDSYICLGKVIFQDIASAFVCYFDAGDDFYNGVDFRIKNFRINLALFPLSFEHRQHLCLMIRIRESLLFFIGIDIWFERELVTDWFEIGPFIVINNRNVQIQTHIYVLVICMYVCMFK